METIKTLFLGIEFSFLHLQKTNKDLFDNAIVRILPMHLPSYGQTNNVRTTLSLISVKIGPQISCL